MGQVVTSRKLWGSEESFKTGSAEKRGRAAEYVEWLLTPAEDREPKTKVALAAQMGVSVQTLYNYAKDAWVQRELGERARGVARVDRLPDILQTLYEQAIDKDNPRSVQAAGKYLDWLERTTGVREAPLNTEDMSNEDLVKVALEVLQRVNEKGDH